MRNDARLVAFNDDGKRVKKPVRLKWSICWAADTPTLEIKLSERKGIHQTVDIPLSSIEAELSTTNLIKYLRNHIRLETGQKLV